jgi:cell division septal protein FtsQ
MSVTRNSKLGPSHLRAKKRRLFLVRSLIVLFFSLIILFRLAIFSGHKKVIINNISIVNNISFSEEEILNIVNQDLTHRYWYLFAKRNFLIFPRLEIKRDLLAQIKTLTKVNISWSGWQNIMIEVEERKPHSVYCGTDILTKSNVCFFVDQRGYIYSLAPVFSGSVFIKN